MPHSLTVLINSISFFRRKAKAANSNAAETKATETAKASGGGGKITLLIIAGIVILGAAAFAYNYCKKKMAPAEPEPQDKELVEITVNKKVDPVTAPASNAERKPLLDNKRDTNSVEIKEEPANGDTESKYETKKVSENGTEQEK